MQRSKTGLFDQLIGAAAQRERHSKAQRVGGLESGDQLHLWKDNGRLAGLAPCSKRLSEMFSCDRGSLKGKVDSAAHTLCREL
jgi:hypothetical protein